MVDPKTPDNKADPKREGSCTPLKPGEAAKQYMTAACDVCPPCRAPCSPDAPPTEAERAVAHLTIKLQQTQESFKRKITECAMLRTEALHGKEAAERARAQAREAAVRLRELEARRDALGEHAHAMLRHHEQTVGQGPAARALELCYRETRDEVDELRVLLSEQGVQLQDYRTKFQQAAALVEERKRQLAALELDNARVAGQVNLEIQGVKVKFQERLRELAPLPDQLRATQRKLSDALTARALAEHAAAHSAEQLHAARERVNTAINFTQARPAEKPMERNFDEKMLAMTQQRVTQLSEINTALKAEVERQKASALRLEEAMLVCERRLHEKMHECAALGGELDRARELGALAVARADAAAAAARRCMDTTVADLRSQLALLNKQVLVAEKERDSTKCRMMCQLNRLQQSFGRAELRVAGLQAQLEAARGSGGADDADDADDAGSEPDAQQQCLCQAIDV